MLSSRTESEYRWYVRRWQAAGRRDASSWVESFAGPHQRRNARAALVWWHRTELGATLRLASQRAPQKVPEAFSERELAQVLQAAVATHQRAAPTLTLLYLTDARIGEATGTSRRHH